MFTGLIEGVAKIESISERQGLTALLLDCPAIDQFQCNIGDSISVNGCCLTVADVGGQDSLIFHINRETLAVTGLRALTKGAAVNIERAAMVGSRLDGHIVTGHVDCTANLVDMEKKASGWKLQVQVLSEDRRLLVKKGSVCLDGVSLTVNEVHDDEQRSLFSVMLIPTTLEKTHFASLSVGWEFNLEWDIVGKYIDRLSQWYQKS